MRRVVLTALAGLVLVAFTLSGCTKKQTPPVQEKKSKMPEKEKEKKFAPREKAETKTPPGQPTTVAPAEKQAAPAQTHAAPAGPLRHRRDSSTGPGDQPGSGDATNKVTAA